VAAEADDVCFCFVAHATKETAEAFQPSDGQVLRLRRISYGR
jgi:hypothetical protein